MARFLNKNQDVHDRKAKPSPSDDFDTVPTVEKPQKAAQKDQKAGAKYTPAQKQAIYAAHYGLTGGTSAPESEK